MIIVQLPKFYLQLFPQDALHQIVNSRVRSQSDDQLAVPSWSGETCIDDVMDDGMNEATFVKPAPRDTAAAKQKTASLPSSAKLSTWKTLDNVVSASRKSSTASSTSIRYYVC